MGTALVLPGKVVAVTRRGSLPSFMVRGSGAGLGVDRPVVYCYKEEKGGIPVVVMSGDLMTMAMSWGQLSMVRRVQSNRMQLEASGA